MSVKSEKAPVRPWPMLLPEDHILLGATSAPHLRMRPSGKTAIAGFSKAKEPPDSGKAGAGK
jgi:hypothetical protein